MTTPSCTRCISVPLCGDCVDGSGLFSQTDAAKPAAPRSSCTAAICSAVGRALAYSPSITAPMRGLAMSTAPTSSCSAGPATLAGTPGGGPREAPSARLAAAGRSRSAVRNGRAGVAGRLPARLARTSELDRVLTWVPRALVAVALGVLLVVAAVEFQPRGVGHCGPDVTLPSGMCLPSNQRAQP